MVLEHYALLCRLLLTVFVSVCSINLMNSTVLRVVSEVDESGGHRMKIFDVAFLVLSYLSTRSQRPSRQGAATL